jgi:hypothetical protein
MVCARMVKLSTPTSRSCRAVLRRSASPFSSYATDGGVGPLCNRIASPDAGPAPPLALMIIHDQQFPLLFQSDRET